MANVKMNSLRNESEKTEIQHRIVKMNFTLSAAISTGEQDFFNKCESKRKQFPKWMEK